MKFKFLSTVLMASGLSWAPSLAAQDQPAEVEETQVIESKDDVDLKEGKFARSFAGSHISWLNKVSAKSFAPGGDLTYNPNYSMSWGFAPVWKVSEHFTLSSTFSLSKELSNSDFSTKKNETFVSDLPIQLGYNYNFKNIPSKEVGFSLGAGVGFEFPTSKMSQFTTKQFALDLGVNATLSFPKILKGLSFTYAPGFYKPFYESQSPRVVDENPLDYDGELGESLPETEKAESPYYQALYFSPGLNMMLSVRNGFGFSLAFIEDLSFSFNYVHSSMYQYAPSSASAGEQEMCVLTEGCDEPADPGGGQRWLFSNAFIYNLSYNLPGAASIFTLNLGAATVSNQLATDGGYNTPFFNRYTVVNFGLSFNIDQFINKIEGGPIL